MAARPAPAASGNNRPLRVGIAGLGTVGSGVVKLLAENAEILRLHCPRAIEVVAVSARDRGKDRGIDLGNLRWCVDPLSLADDPDVDVVAEMIGGADGPAKALVERAIARGKHVVTANKALLAHHGTTLALAAERAGVALAYEAAVAGGIPVIKAMREGLATNRI
jgi:homoserine dehydrogenase